MTLTLRSVPWKRIFVTPANQKTAIAKPSLIMRVGDRLAVRAMLHATPLAPHEKPRELDTEIYVMF